jgi:hypothetical protein
VTLCVGITWTLAVGCAPPPVAPDDSQGDEGAIQAVAGTGGSGGGPARAADAMATPGAPDVAGDRSAADGAPDAGAADAAPSSDGASTPDGARAAEPAGGPPGRITEVFDLGKLHVIDIVIAAADRPKVESGQDARVPCRFTFDGVVIDRVGVRQKGGLYRGFQKLGAKPSLSIKLDEFVPKQTLRGMKKLILNNAGQDESFVNEHMVYEVYRRAGLAAPYTAHAVVTINGFTEGVYVIKEAVDGQFLERTFGKGLDEGNLYEGSFAPMADSDFVTSLARVELKDEVEEMRKRDDIEAAAAAIRTTPAAGFVTEVNKRIDLDQFIASFAVNAVTGDSDDYFFNANNYYLYNSPRDGRFVYLPHGADQALNTARFTLTTPWKTPKGRLGVRIREIPSLDAKYRAELRRIGSPPVWDVTGLLARVAQVAAILKTATRGARVDSDLARFDSRRAAVESFIRAYGLSRK